jgi:hypothetical protein
MAHLFFLPPSRNPPYPGMETNRAGSWFRPDEENSGVREGGFENLPLQENGICAGFDLIDQEE